ncbi:sigma factor, partial [Planctomycetota bacterium]
MKENSGLDRYYSMTLQRNASHNRHGQNPAAAWMKVLPVVSAYVRSLILNFHDSEDVIQEIAVVFANKFPRLDPSRDLVPWVLRIARYEVVNHIRRQGRIPQCFDDDTLVSLAQAYQSLHDETDAIQSSLHECIQKL